MNNKGYSDCHLEESSHNDEDENQESQSLPTETNLIDRSKDQLSHRKSAAVGDNH